MSKELSQYLHYYLGCEIKAENNGTMTYTLNKIGANGFASFKDKNGFDVWLGEGWKPILRKLESMTEEELNERQFSSRDHYERWLIANDRKWPIDDLHWFLKNGFDVFDLIREGLAIDKTTIK